MIRFVVAPDGAVVPDLAARLPGRGIWLSARADVLDSPRARGAFARAARGPVAVSPNLRVGLVASLERRIADHLGLARRAGQAVSGFEKAREWLAGGRAGLIVQASDGSAEERSRFLGARSGQVPAIRPLDAAQLGAIFGRDRAVHVAVLPGRLASGIAIDAARLDGLRSAAESGERTGGGARGRAARDNETTPGDAGGTRERDRAGR